MFLMALMGHICLFAFSSDPFRVLFPTVYISRDRWVVETQNIRRWLGNMTEEDKKRGEAEIQRWLEVGSVEIPPADVRIVTSGGRRIPVHSTVLASASPVLESILGGPHKGRSRGREIPILGVPCDAVQAFVHSLYFARCVSATEEEMIGEHGMHLLALSHAYRVGWLKRAAERALSLRLTAEGVVDVLVLSQRCDAPRLHLRCMQLLSKDFAAVEQTEAWRFLQDHDPWLELHILQFLHHAHLRRRRQARRKAEQRLYAELHEAMDCLRHICADGCGEVGPSGRLLPAHARPPCPNPVSCRGLRQLIRHFAACDRQKRQQHGCRRCKRLWQLLRLHASICDEVDDASCKVPLCIQFKQRMQEKEGELEEDEAERWRLLVKKVASARVMSHLAKRQSQVLV
ncbi:BTB/POZ and TAZ domain-containing protein 1-like isoform X2 [Musa acuminata AAA Group]|uniref:BTB/POZ and TAZ domain-containing protein 1-like isoform X2 n=1 Tax=Musa acuminata AAA Group TaxID=214697 RepID=UPI0031D04519